MCFVWIWEQTAIISLYSIDWLVCITETECLLRGTGWICSYGGYSMYHQFNIQQCEQDQDVPPWSCSQAVSKPVWHIPLLCVQWKTSDDGQRNCPKHIEFYSKNKFEKLLHLVGFIVRIHSRHQRKLSNGHKSVPDRDGERNSETCGRNSVTVCNERTLCNWLV